MNRVVVIARDFVMVLIITIAIMALFGCATVGQPGPTAQTFNQVDKPVPIACIKPEDVPTYPTLTPLAAGATHKQVDAANEADLESFRLYAEAARPLLVQCSKGIKP